MSEQHLFQKLLKSLIHDYGYEQDLMDYGIDFTKDRTRFVVDLVIYQSLQKQRPYIIVEIKKKLLLPAILRQIEKALLASTAEYGILSDGSTHYFFRQVNEGRIVQIPDIPKNKHVFQEFPLKSGLVKPRDLEYKLWQFADKLRFKMRPQQVLEELNKVILSKIIDEEDDKKNVAFWVSAEEWSSKRLQVKFSERMKDILKIAQEKYPEIISSPGFFRLDTEQLMETVAIFQSYSFTKYPELVSTAYANLISKLFENPRFSGFYIPNIVTNFLVEMLNPDPRDSFLDPSCATGALLYEIVSKFQKRGLDQAEIKEFIENRLFGIERKTNFASIAKMQFLVQSFDNNNIRVGESLLPEGPAEEIIRITNGLDFIATVPMFGSRVTNKEILGSSILGQNKRYWMYSDLLIEKSLKWLKPGGRLGIIVPEGFLFNQASMKTRLLIEKEYQIIAIISLPSGLFFPYTGVKTSLLLLERPKHLIQSEYKIFMALLDYKGETNIEDRMKKILAIFSVFPSKKPSDDEGIFTISSKKLRSDSWIVNFYTKELELMLQEGVRLESICKIYSGLRISPKEYIEDEPGATPYVRISNMSEGGIREEGLKSAKPTEVPQEKLLQENDVLFSISGTIGKTALVPQSLAGAIPSSQIAVLRSQTEKIRPKYLNLILSSKQYQSIFETLSRGAVISHLRITDLRRIRIPVPSLKEQDEIIRRIDEIASKKREIQQSTDELNSKIERLIKGE